MMRSRSKTQNNSLSGTKLDIRLIMDLDQNGFNLSKSSIHNNVVKKLLIPKCGLTSRGKFGIEGKVHCCYEQRNTLIVFLSHESWGAIVKV